jgi:hypothetical protein
VADPKDNVNDNIHRMDNGLCVQIAPAENTIKNVVYYKKALKSKPCPDELACDLCRQGPVDAYILRCCHYSYCHGCIVEHLEKNSNQCPNCRTVLARARDLIPNLRLRMVVEAVLNDTFKYQYPKLEKPAVEKVRERERDRKRKRSRSPRRKAK